MLPEKKHRQIKNFIFGNYIVSLHRELAHIADYALTHHMKSRDARHRHCEPQSRTLEKPKTV